MDHILHCAENIAIRNKWPAFFLEPYGLQITVPPTTPTEGTFTADLQLIDPFITYSLAFNGAAGALGINTDDKQLGFPVSGQELPCFEIFRRLYFRNNNAGDVIVTLYGYYVRKGVCE